MELAGLMSKIKCDAGETQIARVAPARTVLRATLSRPPRPGLRRKENIGITIFIVCPSGSLPPAMRRLSASIRTEPGVGSLRLEALTARRAHNQHRFARLFARQARW
jgi:hypothetical protein